MRLSVAFKLNCWSICQLRQNHIVWHIAFKLDNRCVGISEHEKAVAVAGRLTVMIYTHGIVVMADWQHINNAIARHGTWSLNWHYMAADNGIITGIGFLRCVGNPLTGKAIIKCILLGMAVPGDAGGGCQIVPAGAFSLLVMRRVAAAAENIGKNSVSAPGYRADIG